MFKLLLIVGLVIASSQTQASQCQTDNVSLQVLGSGGPEIDDGRFSSSYLIRYKDKARILIDAGSGSSVTFGHSGAKFEDLVAVLLTHLHVDHSVDLPAFVKGSYFTRRASDLTILGPAANALMPSTSDYVQILMGNKGAYAYLEEYVSKNIASPYNTVVHNVPLVKEQIFTYQLAPIVQAQAAFVHHGPVAAVAWRVNIAGCSITFSGDMSNQFNVLSKLAEGTDILVAHNAVPENASVVAKNLHMPPSEIGKIAFQAKAKKVLLSHFMKRTLNSQQQSIDIIAESYPGKIELAQDGKVVAF